MGVWRKACCRERVLADELPARGALGIKAKEAVNAGLVSLVTGFRVERITRDGDRHVLVAEDGRTLTADRAVVLTGFCPDLSFLAELRLELDPTRQAPVRIAAEVDPNVHSCGSVAATGAAGLAQPETGFYLVGATSYGHAPTFLALIGYEQVRSVAAELAGDHDAARHVELTLPTRSSAVARARSMLPGRPWAARVAPRRRRSCRSAALRPAV